MSCQRGADKGTALRERRAMSSQYNKSDKSNEAGAITEKECTNHNDIP